MTRVRMRQHEYYFIVQRRLARHYCWLELLSRPTSVLARVGVGVSAGRVSSRPVPVLSAFVWPVFCASLEVRRPPRVTRAIAARTPRQSTRDRRERPHTTT